MSKMQTLEINVSGKVGAGKSHILTVIEKALKAEYGDDLMIVSRSLELERRMCRDEDMAKLNKERTVIVLTESGETDLKLSTDQGIVSVSHSDEVKASVCLAEMSEDQLFGEIKPQDHSKLPELKVANTGDEPPINGLASGSCSGSVRDERLSNRENTYMLTQVLATENISQELHDKAELKLSELLDKIN